MAVEVCKFNQKGFCKFGDECRKRHIKEICANRDCKDELCLQRHPQLCRYFVFNQSCRFKDGCAFEHRDSDEKTKTRLPVAEPQPILTLLFLNCIDLGCC